MHLESRMRCLAAGLTFDFFDLDWFVASRFNPIHRFLPLFVQTNESGLATTFDQLIRFGDEWRGEEPWMLFGQFRENCCGQHLHESIIGLREAVRSEPLTQHQFAVEFANCFGRHGEWRMVLRCNDRCRSLCECWDAVGGKMRATECSWHVKVRGARGAVGQMEELLD